MLVVVRNPSAGSGYTIGADDGSGDLSEYKLTSDPAGTEETATFPNPSNLNTMIIVTLQPHSPT